MIIGLTGLPRSGKDTAAEWFTRRGYARRQFSAPLKEAAAILLQRPVSQMYGEHGFDREVVMPEWGFSVRWFLQRFGTECLRDQICTDFWIQRMTRDIDSIYPASVVITDLRFDNEAEFVRKRGGIIIDVRRPEITGSTHASDKGVTPDEIVFNDETVDVLHERIGRVMLARHAHTSRAT